MERVVRSCYNWGGIWRELFGALISAGRYYKGWRELFEAFIIREGCGGSYLELLYRRRDLEEAVWSFYNWGGISRCLFGAFILVERSRDACLKQLYQRRDLEEAVWSFYIGGEI